MDLLTSAGAGRWADTGRSLKCDSTPSAGLTEIDQWRVCRSRHWPEDDAGAMLSKMAMSPLRTRGFDDVADLIDGCEAWATR